jgi:hypothetical protein
MSKCVVKEIRALKELLSSNPVASTSSTSMPGNTPLTLPCRGHSNPTLFARYFISSRSSALLQNDRSPETFSASERRFRNTVFSIGEVVQSRRPDRRPREASRSGWSQSIESVSSRCLRHEAGNFGDEGQYQFGTFGDQSVTIARRAKRLNSRPAVHEVALLEPAFRLALSIFRDRVASLCGR